MDFFKNMSQYLNDFLLGLGIWAPILSTVLVYLEGILAFLPLIVFVTVNVYTVGIFWGILLSWIFAVLGSYTTFIFVRKSLSKRFNKKIQNKPKVNKFMKAIGKLKFSQIVLLISCSFTPSFFMNLGVGLTEIKEKKYFLALFIGKLFDIIFLAFIGTSLIECLTNPLKLIRVVVLLLVAYIVSKIINNKFDIDERF